MLNNKKLQTYKLDDLYDKKLLSANEIHLWVIDVNNQRLNNNHSYLNKILDVKEKEKLTRYLLDGHKKRFLYSRSMLKLLISNYLHVEPHRISIKYNERGKPELEEKNNLINLNFNISHSHELIIFVFTLENSIGVDIEYIDKSRDIMGIAKKFFSKDEYSCISKYKDDLQFRIFYILWTFKEALLKCCGTGISSDFKAISIPLIENYHFMNNKNGSCSYFNKIWNYNILELCNEYITNIVYG